MSIPASDDLSATLRERIDAAKSSLREGNVIEALERAESALNLPGGECYDVLYLIAYCKQRLGRSGEARIVSERAASLRPGAADVHFLLGWLYEEQARRALSATAAPATQPAAQRDDTWEKAIKHYRTATLAADRELDNPRVTASWYRLAECLAFVGDWPAAVEAYERFDEAVFEDSIEHRNAPEVAVALDDNPLGALEKRVSLLERLGRAADAAKVTRVAVEQWPDDAFVQRLHVRTLLSANRARDAFAFARKLLETEDETQAQRAETTPDGPLTLAIEAARASGELERWISEAANDASDGIQVGMALQLARRLGAIGANADAIRLYRVVANARIGDADAAWGLASALRASGGVREAIASLIEFTRRCAAMPDLQDDLLGEARLSEWMVSFSAAREALSLIEEEARNPGADFATYYVLGITASAAEEHELADRLLAAGVEKRPDFLPLRLAAARTALGAYDWPRAKQLAAEALRVQPSSACAHLLNAQALAGLDEIEAADAAFKQAIQIASGRAGTAGQVRSAGHQASSVALLFAKFQGQLSDREEHYRDWQVKSQRYYQQAISFDPFNAEAVEGLIDSYISAGKLEIAKSQLARAERGDLPEDVLRRLRTSLRFATSLGTDEHLSELDRQWRDHPTDYATGFKLVAVLFTRERYDEASRALERIRLIRPLDDGVLGWSARLAARQLNYDQAVANIQALRNRYPNRPSVILPLVESYLADFRVEEARSELRRALELPWDKALHQRVRSLLLGSLDIFGDYEAGLELLAKWRAESPNDAMLRDQWVQMLVHAGRGKEAVQEATEFLDQLPNDPQRRVWFLAVCRMAKAYRTAAERLNSFLEGGKPDFATAGELIDLMCDDGRGAEAYELAKGLQPANLDQDALRREWMAKCDLAAGRLDDGVAEFDALLETAIGRRNGELRIRVQAAIAEGLAKAGRYDDALARLDKELTSIPIGEAQVRLALQQQRLAVLHDSGKSDQYIQLLEQLREAYPNTALLNNNLGYTLVDENRDVERAVRLIQRAVAEEPLSAVYLDSLGWAHYKRGDFASARKYLSRAARLRDGRDGVIFDHLGDACYRLGDKLAAREAWTRAGELADAPESSMKDGERHKLHAALRQKLAALDQSQPAPVAKLPTEAP
ncbi:MAG: tetratricopeptide repeat protein [Phycisphaerales bacterium]|nr:tetratricopeptide repeat protein [Phycisphaerales bacterium]